MCLPKGRTRCWHIPVAFPGVADGGRGAEHCRHCSLTHNPMGAPQASAIVLSVYSKAFTLKLGNRVRSGVMEGWATTRCRVHAEMFCSSYTTTVCQC